LGNISRHHISSNVRIRNNNIIMSNIPTINWLENCQSEYIAGDKKQRSEIISEMRSFGFNNDAEWLIKELWIIKK